MWTLHPQFPFVVKNNWLEAVKGVNPARVFILKLQRLKNALKQFNIQHFSDISQRVKQATTKYQLASKLLKQHPFDPTLVTSLQNAKATYLEVSRWEEAFYAQKVVADWLPWEMITFLSSMQE